MKSAVYLISSSGRVKIGYSKNPWKRYRQLCTGCPNPLALVFTFYCHDAPSLERKLHESFSQYRANGEWFNVTAKQVMQEICRIGFSHPEAVIKNQDDFDQIGEDSEEATFDDFNSFFDEMS